MKILVTGSQGTLGQKLVKELESRGHDVWGCDLYHGEKKEIRCDISEARQVERVFSQVRPEAVYHLAAEFGRNNGQQYYEQLWKTNCVGTRNIIEGCIKYTAHLIFASSSEAYGDGADTGDLKEELLTHYVPKFHNEYALTKYTNEKQIQIAIKNNGLKATILRFFNAYGPGEEYNDFRSVVCLFIYRLMKGLPITVYQNYHRVFMYVDDWARSVANVCERTDRFYNGDVFNIGGDEYKSIEELVEMIVRKLGGTRSTITLLPKEIANITNKRPDISRAKLHLCHDNTVDLDRGLDLTIHWMKQRYGEADGGE